MGAGFTGLPEGGPGVGPAQFGEEIELGEGLAAIGRDGLGLGGGEGGGDGVLEAGFPEGGEDFEVGILLGFDVPRFVEEVGVEGFDLQALGFELGFESCIGGDAGGGVAAVPADIFDFIFFDEAGEDFEWVAGFKVQGEVLHQALEAVMQPPIGGGAAGAFGFFNQIDGEDGFVLLDGPVEGGVIGGAEVGAEPEEGGHGVVICY